jgi:hypothetical protein
VQLARDGPHAPVLDRVQPLDPCGQIKWDGHACCASERWSGAGSPGAHGAAAGERSAGRPVRRRGPCRRAPARVSLAESATMVVSQALGVSHTSSGAPTTSSKQPWCVTLSIKLFALSRRSERRRSRQDAVRAACLS